MNALLLIQHEAASRDLRTNVQKEKERLQEGTSTDSETASIATSRERLVADFEETGYGEP